MDPRRALRCGWLLASLLLLALFAPHLHVSARIVPSRLQRIGSAIAVAAADAASSVSDAAAAAAAAAKQALHPSSKPAPAPSPPMPVPPQPQPAPSSAAAPDVLATASWPTIGGSNARQGVTPLSLPIHFGAPMRQVASVGVALPDDAAATLASRCASSVVADANGRVFALCAWPSGTNALHASVLCFDASSLGSDASNAGAKPKLLWTEPLGAVPDEIEPGSSFSGSLALSNDEAWLLVSTRAATYAFSAALGGKPAWVYAAEGAVGPVAAGLLVSAPDPLLAMQPRIYAGVNQGLVCIADGKLLWSFRTTEAPVGSRVSAAAGHEASNTVLYSFWDPPSASVYLVALDASTGVERWSHSFEVAPAFAAAVATSRLQQAPPVVVDDRAYLSVPGRGMVVVCIASGAQVADGTGPLSGARVQIGLAPVLQRADSAAASNDHPTLGQDVLLSVCTEASVGPKTSRSFELCATDVNGINLDISSKYPLGCSKRSSFRSMAPLTQPLLAGNRVIITSLSSDAFVVGSDADSSPDYKRKMRGCVQALPDRAMKLEPWSTTLHRGASFVSTPLLLTPRIAVGLGHNLKGFSLFVLRARHHPSAPTHSLPVPVPAPAPAPMPAADLPVELPISLPEPVLEQQPQAELVDLMPAAASMQAIPIRTIEIVRVAQE